MAVRVVLEVQEGPDRGRKAVLRARQALRVGRTERSDFVLAGDQQLSSRHFLVECDDRACQIRDLESTNGTLLNGQPIGQARLRHGDEIYAGQTLLRVSIESLAADDLAADVPVRSGLGAAALRKPILCLQRRCPSGLELIECDAADPPLHVVAQRIAASAACYVVVDPRRAGLMSDDLVGAAPLVESLGAEGPCVAPLADALPWLERTAGRDAVSLVYASGEPEAVHAQLRGAVSYDPIRRRAAPGEGLLAFYLPSIGRMLLEYWTPDLLAGVLGEAVEGLLVEGAPPAAWQLFCRESMANALEGSGFEIQATPEAAGR